MNADLEGDEAAAGNLRKAAVRPHACARHAEQRRIFPGRAGHAEDAVEPAATACQTDVLQVDLRAVHVRGAVVWQRRPLRVERERRQTLALRVPKRVEVWWVHLRRLNAVGRKPRRTNATICAALDFGRRDESQEARCVQRAAGHRQRRRPDDSSCLGHRRKHLGPDAVFHRGAANLMAVAHDIDAERHRVAGLIGPVRMIRCHRHDDPAEWLARCLRQRRRHDAGQNRARAEKATQCDE